MRRQRRRDTAAELQLRRILYSRGYRYRVDYKFPDLRRRADMAFMRRKVAVFVDGCFWHSCPLHKSIPKSNRDWWVAKLKANVARDRDTDAKLSEMGWTVVRIWEHEHPNEAAERIISVLAHGEAET